LPIRIGLVIRHQLGEAPTKERVVFVCPEVSMRYAGNFNAEWGYLALASNFLRTARVFIVAAGIGATARAAVVFSLMDRPLAEASVAARTLVQPVEPAQPARSAAIVAQLQKQSELLSEHASVSEARRTNAPGTMRPQGAAVVAHVGAGPPAASESSTTQHAPIAAVQSESPRIVAAEAPPARAAVNESNAVPALEAPAPVPAPKAPNRKSGAVARAAPRYDLKRYGAPHYEQRYDPIERGSYADTTSLPVR
jgi:hypothetical protein